MSFTIGLIIGLVLAVVFAAYGYYFWRKMLAEQDLTQRLRRDVSNLRLRATGAESRADQLQKVAAQAVVLKEKLDILNAERQKAKRAEERESPLQVLNDPFAETEDSGLVLELRQEIKLLKESLDLRQFDQQTEQEAQSVDRDHLEHLDKKWKLAREEWEQEKLSLELQINQYKYGSLDTQNVAIQSATDVAQCLELQQQFDALQHEFSTAQAQLVQQAEKLVLAADVVIDRDRLVTQHAEQARQLILAQQSLEQLQSQQSAVVAPADEGQTQHLQERCQWLTETLETTQKELASLQREQLANASTLEIQVLALQQQCDELTDALAIAQAQVLAPVPDTNAAAVDVSLLEAQLSILQKQCDRLTDELAAAQVQNKQLEMIPTLEEQLKKLQAEYDGQAAILEQACQDIEEMLATSVPTLSEEDAEKMRLLQERNDTLTKTLERLEQTVQQQTEQLSQFSELDQQLEALREENEMISRDLSLEKERVASCLQAELQLFELREEHASIEEKHTQHLQATEQRIEQLQSAFTESEQRYTTMQSQQAMMSVQSQSEIKRLKSLAEGLSVLVSGSLQEGGTNADLLLKQYEADRAALEQEVNNLTQQLQRATISPSPI